MLVYTKSCVAVPSFLFTVRTVTGVITALLALLRLTGFLLAFCISLEHGLHKGHALIVPKLLVGLLGLRGLTCCLEGLTIAVIATAVQGVVGLVGTAVGSAMLAKLLTATLLRPVGPPDALRFRLLLALGWAQAALPFALNFLLCFSTMMHSIASRSSSNAHVDSRTVEWLRLYWFCHIIETDPSTIAAGSASPKGKFPSFLSSIQPWGCPSM
jgi:hypothetical protein